MYGISLYRKGTWGGGGCGVVEWWCFAIAPWIVAICMGHGYLYLVKEHGVVVVWWCFVIVIDNSTLLCPGL